MLLVRDRWVRFGRFRKQLGLEVKIKIAVTFVMVFSAARCMQPLSLVDNEMEMYSLMTSFIVFQVDSGVITPGRESE